VKDEKKKNVHIEDEKTTVYKRTGGSRLAKSHPNLKRNSLSSFWREEEKKMGDNRT